MNLWRAWSLSADHKSRRVVWATSERECRKLAKNEFGEAGAASVKSLDIPTTKPLLVEWLNSNVSRIAID